MIIADTNLENILLVFQDGNWYIGVILECSDKNQDCSVKFMKRTNVNLHWISYSCFSFYWVAYKNMVCIIDLLPQAVSSSGWQYILSKHDFDTDCMFLSCHVHVSEWIHTL